MEHAGATMARFSRRSVVKLLLATALCGCLVKGQWSVSTAPGRADANCMCARNSQSACEYICEHESLDRTDYAYQLTTTRISLEHNEISYIAMDSFRGLTRLTSLSLRRLPDTLVHNVLLRFNWITIVPISVFGSLIRLTSLRISYNLITEVRDTSFSVMNGLRVLELGENPIRLLPTNAINSISSLTVLSGSPFNGQWELRQSTALLPLTLNRCETSQYLYIFDSVYSCCRIAPPGWNNCTSGITQSPTREPTPAPTPTSPPTTTRCGSDMGVYRCDNELISHTDWNYALGTREIYLQTNGISIIAQDSFTDIQNTLQILALGQNYISTLANFPFSGLSELVELKLDNNQITYIANGTFSGLVNLRLLFLHSQRTNSLTAVYDTSFSALLSLHNLRMDQNELRVLPIAALNALRPPRGNLRNLSSTSDWVLQVASPGALPLDVSGCASPFPYVRDDGIYTCCRSVASGSCSSLHSSPESTTTMAPTPTLAPTTAPSALAPVALSTASPTLVNTTWAPTTDPTLPSSTTAPTTIVPASTTTAPLTRATSTEVPSAVGGVGKTRSEGGRDSKIIEIVLVVVLVSLLTVVAVGVVWRRHHSNTRQEGAIAQYEATAPDNRMASSVAMTLNPMFTTSITPDIPNASGPQYGHLNDVNNNASDGTQYTRLNQTHLELAEAPVYTALGKASDRPEHVTYNVLDVRKPRGNAEVSTAMPEYAALGHRHTDTQAAYYASLEPRHGLDRVEPDAAIA